MTTITSRSNTQQSRNIHLHVDETRGKIMTSNHYLLLPIEDVSKLSTPEETALSSPPIFSNQTTNLSPALNVHSPTTQQSF